MHKETPKFIVVDPTDGLLIEEPRERFLESIEEQIPLSAASFYTGLGLIAAIAIVFGAGMNDTTFVASSIIKTIGVIAMLALGAKVVASLIFRNKAKNENIAQMKNTKQYRDFIQECQDWVVARYGIYFNDDEIYTLFGLQEILLNDEERKEFEENKAIKVKPGERITYRLAVPPTQEGEHLALCSLYCDEKDGTAKLAFREVEL